MAEPELIRLGAQKTADTLMDFTGRIGTKQLGSSTEQYQSNGSANLGPTRDSYIARELPKTEELT